MVFAQHVADAGGRLLEGLVGGQAAFVHGVQNAPVYRLQAVPDIGQCPSHDDGHGVFDVGLFHFVHQVALGDHLVGETDVLRFVASVMCQIRHLHKLLSFSALSLRTSVVLRAANQNSDDCRWQSYLNVAHWRGNPFSPFS